MIFRSHIIAAVAMALIAAGSIFAGDKKDTKSDTDKPVKLPHNALAIKGKVIGDNGKPETDAEIRVKPLDRKGEETIALTDSRGRYIVPNLIVGNYSITAYDPNGFARSRAIIKTDRKGWANVNFDLGLDKAFGDGANRIGGHEHFTQPSSHGGGKIQ